MAGNKKSSAREQNIKMFIICVAATCLISILLLVGRILFSDSLRYVFLIWNLVLAAVPALLAWWLADRLKTRSWLAWQQVLITAAVIAFLPNSFYLITDFVHLRQTSEASLYFDVVMLSSFVFNGMILGFITIHLLHRQLIRRLNDRNALMLVMFIFLLASFATYLGRFTRFNTWDIILRPAGLLFDVSDRFVNPSLHTDTYLATITLFGVLFSAYLVFYFGLKLLRALTP